MTEIEPIEVTPKPQRIKAILWGGGETQAGEVKRWLDKWSIDSTYAPAITAPKNGVTLSERMHIIDEEGFDMVLFPGEWILYYPKSGQVYVSKDADFKKGFVQ